jgi:hypothetical protein
MNNISLLKIIKNRIGYTRPIIYIILVLLSIVYFIFFRKLLFDEAFIVFILLCTIYIIILFVKETLKINYYFKYGIETIAYVQKSNYALPFNTYFEIGAYNKFISPWKTEEIKSGICCNYYINNEIYESNIIFKENDETISIKEGSRINILVNPKNKNEAIIKELFMKI